MTPLKGKLDMIWRKLLVGLQVLTSLLLPRCYFQGGSERVISCSLPGFDDASPKAYAVVIYLYITATTGSYRTPSSFKK